MTHQVQILPHGRRIAVPAGVTLLEAALAQGIAYPHGCRAGRCGSCLSRLLHGEVTLLPHSRFALSAQERAQGLILACCAVPLTDAVVVWGNGEADTLVDPVQQRNARVTAIEDVTHDIKCIQLAVADDDPLVFKAGQYAQLTFPGVPACAYSMASEPGQRVLEFHIRRVPGGTASEQIHARVALGDIVAVEGPLGASYLREQHAGPILCVAGGSGLAPMQSIVDAALAGGMAQPIHVYFGVRSERDLYRLAHFQALARLHPALRFTPVLSAADAGTAHRTGWVTDAVAQDLHDFKGWKAYVAGPPAMVDAVLRLLRSRRLGAEDVHADVFFTPAPPTAR